MSEKYKVKYFKVKENDYEISHIKAKVVRRNIIKGGIRQKDFFIELSFITIECDMEIAKLPFSRCIKIPAEGLITSEEEGIRMANQYFEKHIDEIVKNSCSDYELAE